MIAEVAFLAPIHHVPTRGQPRHDLFATTMRAELGEVSRAETTEVGRFPVPQGDALLRKPIEVLAHGGRHWTRLPPGADHGWDAGDETDTLLGYLARRIGSARHDDLFAMTPLRDRPRANATPRARGAVFGTTPGRVLEDGTAAAEASARRHLDEGVLIVDGEPWIRYRPLLQFSFGCPLGFDVNLLRATGSVHWWSARKLFEREGYLPFDPADHGKLSHAWTSQAGLAAMIEARRLADMRDAGVGAHAILLNLNAMPADAVRALTRIARRAGDGDDGTEGIVSRLRTLDRIGAIGGIGPEEAPEAARTLLDAYLHMEARPGFDRATRRALSYLRDFAVPRLAPAVPAEDGAALGGLAP